MDKINIKIEGLNEKESQVYTGLLSLKRATVLELARTSGLKRSNLYRLLENLKDKGLVSEIYRGRKHFYIAESPQTILNYLNHEKKRIKKLIPQLESLEDEVIDRPKIRFYEGKSGFKKIYDDIYKDKEEIIAFANVDKLYQAVEFHPDCVAKRVKLGIPARVILPDTKLGRKRRKIDKSELRKTKIVSDFEPGETLFLVTDSKVAIFSLKKWFVGVLIENREIAKSIKALFNILWKRLD